ncbi:hypothetical protein [Acidithiobacillus ferriphilus]|uniref:hypothetical protein n=1 Tax=Acidithiobacillus ferriphilus TaxID=1689834 RepID=UPI001C06FF9E|nr:hypothetical protein [Acidithiobacillus ferriphilus]MBU2852929.1 hypothetical protein [Acidithiobacillus ferriphilus]
MIAEGLSGKSVDELKAEILEMENAVKELKKSIKDRESAIVELIAKYKVGDRVVVMDYSGRESVYKITERRIEFSLGDVRYWGKLVKKDGSLGQLDTDLSYKELRKA